jgi:hypothetical protein
VSTRSFRPLVYADRRAREQAAQLLPPGTVLEVEIARWILNGSVRSARRAVIRVVSPDGRLEALCTRRPGYFRPRPRGWYVSALRPTLNRR